MARVRLNDLLSRSDGWNKLLANPELARRVLRPQQHSISEIFPNVFADDPRYLRMTTDLVEALNKSEWAPTTDDHGLSDNFLTGGYSQLLSVSVYKKLPMSIGMEDNRELRSSLSIREPDDLFKRIAHEVGTALYSRKRPASARFRREASTSIPDFQIGAEPKARDLNHAYSYLLGSAPITPISLLTAGIYPIYIIVNRFQSDQVGKERWSWTGFDRVKVDASTPWPGHHGMRVRTAYAMSGTVSYIQTALMAEQREYYLNEYEYTYKHRRPEDVAAKINKFKYVAGIDVTQFDQTVGEGHLELFCEQIARFWAERPASLLRLTLGGPSISACPYAAGKEDRWAAVGDPFDVESYTLRKGLPSGHPLNPDIGKFCMTCEILYRMAQIDPTIVNAIPDILRGYHSRFGFLNSADDNLIMFNRQSDVEAFFKTEGTFSLDREEIPIFLGVVYGMKNGSVIGQPNLTSFLARWLVPEQSIGKKIGDRRSFFQTGWHERIYHYDTHWAFSDMYKILNEVARRHFGAGVDALLAGRREPLAAQSALTYADRMFLMDAASVHYKIDIEDVSPHLADDFAMRLAPEQVATITKRFHTADVSYDLQRTSV